MLREKRELTGQINELRIELDSERNCGRKRMRGEEFEEGGVQKQGRIGYDGQESGRKIGREEAVSLPIRSFEDNFLTGKSENNQNGEKNQNGVNGQSSANGQNGYDSGSEKEARTYSNNSDGKGRSSYSQGEHSTYPQQESSSSSSSSSSSLVRAQTSRVQTHTYDQGNRIVFYFAFFIMRISNAVRFDLNKQECL